VNSSELAQRVGINEVAESMMAFNTNYKDTGLFGVYAVAKVSSNVVFLEYFSKQSNILVLQFLKLAYKHEKRHGLSATTNEHLSPL
jgi:hypothetical protein